MDFNEKLDNFISKLNECEDVINEDGVYIGVCIDHDDLCFIHDLISEYKELTD